MPKNMRVVHMVSVKMTIKNFILKRKSTNKQKDDTERCSKGNGVAY